MPRRPTELRRALFVLSALFAGAAIALPWNLTALSSLDELAAAWGRLRGYVAAFGAPDLSPAMLRRCLDLALETVAVAILGTVLGLLLGYPIALLASRCVVLGDELATGLRGALRRVLLELARFALDVLRGVPDFVWALLIVPFTGINATTGLLAIAVSVAGIYGKVLSEQWDNVDPRRYEALRSTGASRLAVFCYGVQPLAARAMQSFVLMRFECAVRNASVIGVVGGGGLGSALWNEYTDSHWPRVATVLLTLLAVTAATDLGANLVRRQLRVDPNHPRAGGAPTRAEARRRRLTIAALLVAGVALAAFVLGDDVAAAAAELRRIEWRWIGNFVAGLAVPDVTPATLWSVLRNSITPLAIGVVATGLGALGAAMLTWPASVAFQLDAHRFTGERLTALGRARRWLLLAAAKLVALVCRAVPEVAWVVLLAVFFRLGVTPCVLAVALHTTGVLHRVFTETLDNLPYGELEKVGNGGRGQIFLYGGLPRAWPDWRTYVFFQFEVNVRAGVALGMVGAGGLGHAFAFSLDWRDYPTASTLLWAMVLLTVLIDRTSRRLQLRRREC